MLHPLMLLGLLGLAIPVIIHLIQKQRLKPQLLATMEFLDREDVANAFAPRPRDLLQLLLRLLLLLLFVLLMARLALSGGEVGPRTITVILDQSLSMQQKTPGGKPLFEVHKANIEALINTLGPRDKLALLLAGDEVTAQTGFSNNKAELRRQLERFAPTDGGALALMPALEAAVQQLRGRHEVNAAVLVFSDHQAANYSAAAGDMARKLDAGNVRIFLVDEKRAEDENIAVTAGRFTPGRVYLGASAKFEASLRNFSAKEKSARVTFYEGTQGSESRELTLAPGEEAEVDLVQRFESPVDVACHVVTDDDNLPADNRFHLPMRMKERRQVLLVTATPPPGEDSAEDVSYQGTDLLAYALNPGEALGQSTGTYISVRRATPQILERLSLPLYSLIILSGTVEIPEQSARDLKAFVANGGGLMLMPDENVAPGRFNEILQPLLGGFLLGQTRQPDPVQALDSNEARVQHPLLTPLLRGEWGGIKDIHFREYFTVAASGAAKTVMVAANGDPLALLLPVERGRIYLQLFSCNLTSGSLPRSTAFVPLVQHLAASIGRGEENTPGEHLRVGESVRVSVPEFRGLAGNVLARGPAEAAFPLQGPGRDEILAKGLTLAGTYELVHPGKKSGRRHWLAVNPVEAESDLRPLPAADQEKLFGTGNVLRLPYAELGDKFARRHELAWLVIVLVFIAFAIEAVAGAWQSRSSARAEDNRADADASGGAVA